ncbi:ABC transporter ATP-binding protein [Grimontia hollisae]|uniref:ABC-type polar amino acid transport system ATPase component n=1 Tax=Grimontia hollisae CIP 101886 TaxID=675812 RepID=D0I6F4_GRIHO|nr:ABC transporter ATP-binding protein [Grimontia hollisae]AMG31583.1 ABC transporter ATP-binding protein [Grimontia hollisae]EEY72223.1 ABC-type polar amino acid transport system ATPase component [Grimontia hollisae CIP 101886]MDF2185956.1 ABC transporter ATP-binding protein [Grimontia hollisae]STO45298.1 Putative multidrug export ATP-binding/permease protein SAV1866 [Grimontia hollisae]STQ76337.1 Putative multidrug export ATP-binding/permease protein SAV1866 [Grimontia hollisae]
MIYKLFERITLAFPPSEPEQPPNSLLAFCRHYTKGFERPLLAMSLLTALIAIAEVSLFGFMGQLVDWLANQDRTTFLADEGNTLLGMGLLILIGMPLLVSLHSLVIHQTLLGNYPMSIRWMAHRYLLRQSIGFYQNDFAGRIATKVMQTALSIRETVMKLLDVAVYISVYFAMMLFMVGQADIRLMIPLILWLVAYIGIQIYFVPKLKAVSTEQADARSLMTGRIVDSYTNIATVKLFSHTDRETEYAEEGMGVFMDTVYRQMRLATGFNIAVEIANYALVFAIGTISIWLWLDSAITIGAIAIAVSLALRINGMSKWIMWEIGSLFENIGTVVDGMSTLSKPVEVMDKPNAPALDVPQGAISFTDVCFHYGEGKGVIEKLNLNIKPGEKVGLVGRSGAGKSTLVNLLMRFHDVEGGEIRIDGQNIAEVTQDSLRANIGMVTQDTSLLHRSIRENILYGNPSASEEAMLEAAKKAQAHDFIETLSDPHGNRGYDSQVGERGVKLSGGQRQRVAISRVLLKDAPILILDEATSALDSEVEAAIQESLYQLMEGKTVIAIAHRLSTIAAMDRLVVLDQGQIVEQGTHKELIASGGIYAQLWQHQTGGFIGD